MCGESDAYETGYQDGLGESAKEIRKLKKEIKKLRKILLEEFDWY